MSQEGIYVTGVVIPCGIPDHENDILSKKDIKIIFTKYLRHDTDTMHSYIRNEGVDLLANWISEKDEDIAGKIAPAGSWLSTFYVTNNEIINSIKDKSIQGISLGSVPKIATTQKYWFINKSINYRDLDTIEEVVPMFISFVDKPSNGFGLRIESYNVYINKSVNEDVKMNDKEEIIDTEEKLSLTGWAKVIKTFQSLGINKSETGSAVKTEQEVKVETKSDDISNAELLQKIPEAVSTGITSAFEKMGEAKKQEEEEVKAKPINKNEKEEEIVEPVKEEEEEEEIAEKAKEIGVNKRATTKTENVEQPNTTTNFYEKSGRNRWGIRIR